MRRAGDPPAPAGGRSGRRVSLALCAATILLGACATAHRSGSPPRVFDLQLAPARAVPAGCAVTLSFQAESEVDLVQAKVTWRIRRVLPSGRPSVDNWYAVLPIAEHVSAPKT